MPKVKKKKATKTPRLSTRSADVRVSRGRTHPAEASFPVAASRPSLPRGYAKTLGEIKQRIKQERLRVVLAANTAKVLLYWDIGRVEIAARDEPVKYPTIRAEVSSTSSRNAGTRGSESRRAENTGAQRKLTHARSP